MTHKMSLNGLHLHCFHFFFTASSKGGAAHPQAQPHLLALGPRFPVSQGVKRTVSGWVASYSTSTKRKWTASFLQLFGVSVIKEQNRTQKLFLISISITYLEIRELVTRFYSTSQHKLDDTRQRMWWSFDLTEINEVILWVVLRWHQLRLNLWVKTSAFKDGPMIRPLPTFCFWWCWEKSKQKAWGRNLKIVSAAWICKPQSTGRWLMWRSQWSSVGLPRKGGSSPRRCGWSP